MTGLAETLCAIIATARIRAVVFAVGGALALAAPALAETSLAETSLAEPCRREVIDIRSPGGTARFGVEIAESPKERARGLMFREHLDAGAGMLFLFDPPREVAFWMRNTPLPLDLIFIAPSGKVVRVGANAVPFSDAAIPSGAEVSAVLEINAGLAARLGITPGAEARHPAFTAAPVWPCAR